MDTRKLGAIDTSPGHKEQDNQVSSFACVKHKNIHPNTDESPELREIIDKLTFVSVVDLERELSLVQHSTRLYLVNHGALW